MKKIVFLGLGYNDNYQAKVFIYDSDGYLIYSGQTYSGVIYLKLCMGKVYHVVAIHRGMVIDKYFYVGKNDTYCFAFPNILYNESRIITFLLTDYYYDNLPIERGEITLWPKQ